MRDLTKTCFFTLITTTYNRNNGNNFKISLKPNYLKSNGQDGIDPSARRGGEGGEGGGEEVRILCWLLDLLLTAPSCAPATPINSDSYFKEVKEDIDDMETEADNLEAFGDEAQDVPEEEQVPILMLLLRLLLIRLLLLLLLVQKVDCFICGVLAVRPQLAACLHSACRWDSWSCSCSCYLSVQVVCRRAGGQGALCQVWSS